MATNYVQTTRQIVTAAMRKLGKVPTTQGVDGEEFVQGLFELNLMLKGWQNKNLDLWLKGEQSLTLTPGTVDHYLDPERPMKVLSARTKRSGIETPMTQMTREEYDTLPQKDTAGFPTQFYYDRQAENAVFYVWPVLSTGSALTTVEITHVREIEDITTGSETLDMPVEWYDAVIYCLADRLSDTYSLERPKITQRAEVLLRDALAFDREGSVFFGEECY